MITKKKKAKKKIDKKMISYVLLTSSVWALGIAGLGYINEYTSMDTISFDFAKPKDYVLVFNRDIEKGEVIKETDVSLKKVDTEYISTGSMQNYKEVVGNVARNKNYQNQQITSSDIMLPAIYEGEYISYSIPVNLASLNDNGIKPGDYVDVSVNFNEKNIKLDNYEGKKEKRNINKPSQIVASKVLVKKIVDGKGNPLINQEAQSSEEKQQAAFVYVFVPKDKLVHLDDAKKRGALNLLRYLNDDYKGATENYVPSWEDKNIVE